MRKKLFKRLAAAAIAVICTLSMGTTAFAGPPMLGDWKNVDEYGKITYGRVRTNSYDIKADGTVELRAWTDYTYDDLGNMTTHYYFYDPGLESWTFWSEFICDNMGRYIKRISYADVYPSISAMQEYSYDNLGNLATEAHYEGDSLKYTDKYSYDAMGNCIKRTSDTGDGYKGSWTDYAYDAMGNLIKSALYNNNDLDLLKEYSYDNMGSLVKEVEHYYPTGSVTVTSNDYSYDNLGNMTKKVSYDSNGFLKEYNYDNLGNMTKEVWYRSDGSLNWIREYSYDNLGNMTKEIFYGSDGSLSRIYEYSYDTLGRLTKEVYTSADPSKGFSLVEHIYK